MRLLGTVRVAFRLLALALLTASALVRLGVRARLAGPCPHAATRQSRAWARRMLRLLGVSLDVHGAPPAGPVLLLANHRSYVDIAAILSQRACAFLAKAEIGGWPLFGAAARQTHTVFVRREDKTSRRAARAGALALLRQGVAFAAFPEGTTKRGPGTLPFFPGLFELAAEHGVPVVPVAIEYADRADAWVGDNSFLGHFWTCFRKRRVEVSIAFGPTLRAAEVDDLKGRAETWIRARLEELGARSAPERARLDSLTGPPRGRAASATFA